MNKIYLNFEEYENLGFNTSDIANFNVLETLARKKLDYWTKNRITEVTDDIRLATALIIDFLTQKECPKVTSMSNDGMSATYALQSDEYLEKELYFKIAEILGSDFMCIY